MSLLFSVVGAELAGDALADEKKDSGYLEYPVMRPDEETRLEWIAAYNNAPRAYIDTEKLEIPSKGGSQDLLSHLLYTPAERDQDSCGNCWAWAGTGCLGIALDAQEGIKDRLSVQYINSCEYAAIGKTCCDGGWLYNFADYYTNTGKCIPWSNTNAHWQDGDASCDTPCGSISTTPNYPITSINEATIVTQTVNQTAAIANIKNMLGQDKGVWFGFYLPTEAAWSDFQSFWNSDAESVAYDMDQWCGTPWDPYGGAGGHAVLCVGYNDEAGTANDYWIMLNSWGTETGRPNGLFRIEMDMDYAGVMGPGDYSFYWQNLNVTFGDMSLPDIDISPTSFEKTLAPDTSQSYSLFISNTGSADLTYSITDEDTTLTAPAEASGTLLSTGVEVAEGPPLHFPIDHESSHDKEPVMKDAYDAGQAGVISGNASVVLDIPLERNTVAEAEGTFTAGGWQNIMTDDFEGLFPGSTWDMYTPGIDAYWGKDSYKPHAGSYSVFCAKTGSEAVTPPAPYPNNMNSWMIYGPFSLADATDAELNFNWWYDTESDCDYIGYYASIDDISYYGNKDSGDSGGWEAKSFDLTSVYTLGDLCGQSEVWVSFIFTSNSSIAYTGAFIDDVVLRKFVSGVAPHIDSLSSAEGPVDARVVISGSNFGATKGTSTVKFNGINADISAWSETEIVAWVPDGATTGNVVVHTGQGDSNALPFTVTASPVDYYAVIVGIADYPGSANDLNYTDDDAWDIHNALLADANWEESHITMLLDSDATKANIQSAIAGMGSTGDGNDLFFLSYSGHGGNAADQPPLDEADGWDEYLAQYDFQTSPIWDDELAEWLAALPSRKVAVSLDSCFSGGQVKAGSEGIVRCLAAEGATARGDGFVRDIDDISGGVALAACDENQLSWEFLDLENGLYTYYFVEGLAGPADSNSDDMISMEEAFNYLNPLVSAYPVSEQQNPQMYDGYPDELVILLSELNNPPNVPSNPSPTNHATGVSTNADLSWTGSDPDPGDTVSYDVYFGTSASPPLVSSDQAACSYNPGTLNIDNKYYWKIVATDNHAASTSGPVWDFTTGAEAEDCPWLSESPDSGTVPDGSSADTINVNFDTTGLGEGDYTAEVIVSSNDPVDPEITVPVTLHVVSESTFQWTKTNGPDGGYINALAIDPQTPSILYAGTDKGRVFRSTDSGGQWSDVSLPVQIDVNALAINSANTTVIYASTDSGVYGSDNSGQSWALLLAVNDTLVLSLQVDPDTPSTIYAGVGRPGYTPTNGGVYKSTDGGQNWAAINNGLPEHGWGDTTIMPIQTLDIDPDNTTIIYAGTVNHAYGPEGLYKSIDGGANWNYASSGIGLAPVDVDALAIDPQTTTTLYLGTWNGVYKSTDGGDNWSKSSTGLPSTMKNVVALAIDPSNPDIIYAGMEYHEGVYKSIDAGANWNPANLGLPGAGCDALAIDPSNPTTLYTAVRGLAHKSTDAGASWLEIFSGFSNADIYDVAVDPQNTSTVYASVYDIGLSRSLDGGENWEKVHSGTVHSIAIDPDTPATIYATGSDLIKSTDGGENWNSIWYPYTYAIAIDPQNTSTIYLVAYQDPPGSYYLYKSVDGGQNWSWLPRSWPMGISCIAIDPINPDILYFTTTKLAYLEKSADGGQTWVNKGCFGDYIWDIAIDPTNPDIIYLAGEDGVFMSQDEGETWEGRSEGLPSTDVLALVIDPDNPSVLYAGTFGGGVFKSTNRGENWIPMNEGLDNLCVKALAIGTSSTILYAGTYYGGVYSSSPTSLSVTTNDATNVITSSATLNGNLDGLGTASSVDVSFEWGTETGIYPNETTSEVMTTAGPFSFDLPGLTPGTRYYFRARAVGDSSSYGNEISFTTKLEAPTDFDATTVSTSQVNLSWTKGIGAEKTMVRRSTSSYPTAPDSGDQVYFDTGTAKSDTGLTPGTHYYYSSWSWVQGSDIWSDTYATDDATTTTAVALATVSTSAATSVEETTASGHGVITSTGGEDCDYRGFVWGTTSHSDPGDTVPASSGYDSNWTENGSYGTGIFNHDITSLTEGTKYYFRACAHNSAGWSYGVEQSFLSKPEPPASFSATNFDTTRIDLSWTKGAGAWKTKIQRKEGSYPVDRTDGTQIYFDTGIAKSDTGLTPNTAYYYRAWSYVEGSEQWSDTYAQASAGTFSGYAIDLVSGWNLVSLPLIPDNTDIDAVISAANLASGNLANIEMVYTFNTTTESWMWWNGSLASTLNTMEDGRGYWVYTTAADTLTVHGTEAGHPGADYPVLTGWDMIGFTSTSDMAPESYLASVVGKYTMLYRWDNGGWLWWMNGNPASTFTNMEPTYGYWLFMTADGTISPP